MPEQKPGNAKGGAQRSRVPLDLQTELHPAWQAMIRYCRELGYGEIASVKIHDGLPVCAEVVTQKIRWS